MDIVNKMDIVDRADKVEKMKNVSTSTDEKIAKTLGYVLLSHIAVIGILYYGVMNFIVG